MEKRPVSITVIATIFIILSIPGILALSTISFGNALAGSPSPMDFGANVGGFLLAASSLGLFFSAIALLELKKWAKRWAIITAAVLAAASLCCGIFILFFTPAYSEAEAIVNQIIGSYLCLSVPLLIIAIFYLALYNSGGVIPGRVIPGRVIPGTQYLIRMV